MAVILLVDDNADNQEIYCRILEHRGHTCHRADNGAVGVEMARELGPDVILMDISMPVMDGWEAIQVLKGNPQTDAIPVVALTARALRSDEERAYALGFDHYLRKPLEPNMVVRVVEELVGRTPGHSRPGRP